MSFWKVFAAGLTLFAVHKILEYRESSRKVSNLPGMRPAFSSLSLFGVFMPTFSLNPGLNWHWAWRNRVYSKYGVHTMSQLSYTSGAPAIYTRSMDVARQILTTKGFEKSPLASQTISSWGPNMLGLNGAEWSRHRRIVNPAFAPETSASITFAVGAALINSIFRRYAMVWDEATSLYQDMTQGEGWRDNAMIPDIHNITSKFALILISRCGFGTPVAWNWTSPSFGVHVGEALRIFSDSIIARMLTPRWMYRLRIPSLLTIESAYISLRQFMRDLIQDRKEELFTNQDGKNEHKDVFRLMVRASESEGSLRLSDEELTGNTFLMLFAGHETTARALDATMGFLALYEDIQEEVYQEIKSVAAADGKLNFNDLSRLNKVQACFLEAERLFPAAYVLFRQTTETVVLKTDEEDGHGGQLILEPDTMVVVDVVGLHYNAKYFPEPEEFRPSRWYGVPDSEMTMFSMGPRVCIGRRFALTEGVAFLGNLLRDWKLHVDLNPGETRAQWRERVMVGNAGMTLGVGTVPVRLTRR
ncbi:cytochrome P450 [Mycena rebaudengoi]|nr:cytochrome P450 [Mycena rebaudengoi]